MAKKSQRRSAQSQKDQSGCIWGLISIFHFRQGRITRKLISDRRRWKRHAFDAGYQTNFETYKGTDPSIGNFSDAKGKEKLAIEVGKTSVKKLMEEEISSIRDPMKQVNVTEEQIQSNLKHGSRFQKAHRNTSKSCDRTCDIHVSHLKSAASLEPQQPSVTNVLEEPSNNPDLARSIEEFCSQIHQFLEVRPPIESVRDSCDVQNGNSCVNHEQIDELSMQIFQEQFLMQGKLRDALEVFMNQKFIDGKQLVNGGVLHPYEQFLNALEILNSKKEKFVNGKHIKEDGAIDQPTKIRDVLEMLNSNKELFLKLLQDSNSLLAKHVQELQDAQEEKIKPSKSFRGGNLSKLVTKSRQSEELLCPKQFPDKNLHTFFRRKIKSRDGNLSKEINDPEASNRIIVLKPGPGSMQNSESEINGGSSPQSQYSLSNNMQHMKIASRFSFREIRRKLKDAMRENKKEHHWISMDGILHRIPYKHQDFGDGSKVILGENVGSVFPSKTFINPERTAKPSSFTMNNNKTVKPTHCEPNVGNDVASTSGDGMKNFNINNVVLPRQRESRIYLEGKKHLSAMLVNGDKDEDLSRRQGPGTLGRILSLPEYNLSPVCSPGRDREQSFVAAHTILYPYENLQMVEKKIIGHLEKENNIHCQVPLNQDIEASDMLESSSNISNELFDDLEIQKSLCSVKDDFSTRDDMKILGTADVLFADESSVLDATSEVNNTCVTTTEQRVDAPKLCEEKGDIEFSRLDLPEDSQAFSSSFETSSPRCSSCQKLDDVQSINDRSERPSPVSVLEPFTDEIISPAKSISQTAEPPMQPIQIQFEDHDSSAMRLIPSDSEIYLQSYTDDKRSTIEFIIAVLQASDLSWNELMWMWHSSDQLLDPSLFDEVEDSLSSQCYIDQKLVFDYVNEVLLGTCKRYFGCSHWLSFVKPNIRPVPMNKNVVYEVLEGIDWQLFLSLPPCTLDQLIGKDMATAESWMDLRFDTEDIGIEMSEVILIELIDDITYELCT